MSTLIQKLRTVTLGTVHDLLDKAIDDNSPSALKQHVRDLEQALHEMRDNAAVQAGQLRTAIRRRSELTDRLEIEKSQITQILAGDSPVKEQLARNKAELVVSLQRQIADLAEEEKIQQQNSTALDKAVLELEGRYQSLTMRLRDLERVDRDSKAKEQAASALQTAESLLGNSATASVDDVEDRIKTRSDIAGERFDRAVRSMDTNAHDDAAAVDTLLAQLRPTATPSQS